MNNTKKRPSPRIGVSPGAVLEAIAEKPPGRYEAGELMRGHWRRVPKRGRGRYGAILKSLVLARLFPCLRWVGEKTNGHQLYEVLPSARSGGRL